MVHKNRKYTVVRIETAKELAHKLTQYTWCGCNGFLYGDMAFLNDSFSADGAQEYAVFRNGNQIESITFGWCTEEEALGFINQLFNGEIGEDMGPTLPLIQSPEEHGRCPLCA
jgi:hypothetical protein